ncbi:MAG: protein-glutamate O-methyltransferase [Gammaproteobacteria bacterium]|nr:protein-glutamate O-methyltransferase [Gammaproteobacteria bacterium]
MQNREFSFSRKNFDFLRKISNEKTGIVVSDDKFDMFYSRLSRRVRWLGLSNFDEYCDFIEQGGAKGELTELINSVTTNLTSFFREQHHFDYLKETVIPELLVKNRADKEMSVWSSGCSTGEEPYSLAITLLDALRDNLNWSVRIDATDVDSNVLATAESGVYVYDHLNGMSKQCLRTWFQRGMGNNADRVRVKSIVRSMIDFHELNLVGNWSVAEKKDVIFCRNVIIYFDKKFKKRLVDKYADVLKVGGYLFIGHSESLFNITDRFELIGKTIYRKIK